jgi:hypothetical protein
VDHSILINILGFDKNTEYATNDRCPVSDIAAEPECRYINCLLIRRRPY